MQTNAFFNNRHQAKLWAAADNFKALDNIKMGLKAAIQFIDEYKLYKFAVEYCWPLNVAISTYAQHPMVYLKRGIFYWF